MEWGGGWVAHGIIVSWGLGLGLDNSSLKSKCNLYGRYPTNVSSYDQPKINKKKKKIIIYLSRHKCIFIFVIRFIINLKCLICYQMAKAGRGAVMAATVISNDSGAELRGSRSSQNTLDSVSWSNKPSLETHGRRNSAGRCIACW